MHHYQQGVYLSGQGFFFGGQVYFGRLVELFFLISGYVMYKYQDLIKQGLSIKYFYLKRALRLLPLTALAAIVYEGGGMLYRRATGSDEFGVLNLSGTLFDALGVQAGWASQNPFINNPTWYVSVLLLCYILFYCINKISSMKDINILYLYTSVVLIGVGILSYGINLPFLNVDAARGYYSFFTGVILANYLKRRRRVGRGCTAVALVVIALTAYTVVYYTKELSIPFDDYFWLTFAFFPAIIVLAETDVAARLFCWRGWSFFAKFSFDVYIWHICFEIFWKYLLLSNPVLQAMTEWKMMLIALAIDEVIGLISHCMLERPIIKRTNKYLANLQ